MLKMDEDHTMHCGEINHKHLVYIAVPLAIKNNIIFLNISCNNPPDWQKFKTLKMQWDVGQRKVQSSVDRIYTDTTV